MASLGRSLEFAAFVALAGPLDLFVRRRCRAAEPLLTQKKNGGPMAAVFPIARNQLLQTDFALRRRDATRPITPALNSEIVSGSGTVMAPNNPPLSPLIPSVK